MKSFLKKMNRGIALAVILLVGLIIFFIYDSAAFAKEEPALKDWLEQYLQECEKVNLLPEEYRKPGADVPDSIIKTKTQEAKDFVEKYFTEYSRYSNNQYYSTDRKQMMLAAESMFLNNSANEAAIEDAQFSLMNISSIRKQSTDAVRIEFTANMTVTASPVAHYLQIARPGWGNAGGAGGEPQTMTAELNYTLMLFKIDGEWKIAYVEGGHYYGGYTRSVVVG